MALECVRNLLAGLNLEAVQKQLFEESLDSQVQRVTVGQARVTWPALVVDEEDRVQRMKGRIRRGRRAI